MEYFYFTLHGHLHFIQCYEDLRFFLVACLFVCFPDIRVEQLLLANNVIMVWPLHPQSFYILCFYSIKWWNQLSVFVVEVIVLKNTKLLYILQNTADLLNFSCNAAVINKNHCCKTIKNCMSKLEWLSDFDNIKKTNNTNLLSHLNSFSFFELQIRSSCNKI